MTPNAPSGYKWGMKPDTRNSVKLSQPNEKRLKRVVEQMQKRTNVRPSLQAIANAAITFGLSSLEKENGVSK